MRARTTWTYLRWLDSIEDTRSRARIQVRVDRLVHGNPGPHRRLGGGISELKIDFGPGYRVYYAHTTPDTIVLLTGGNKATQRADIAKALDIANNL